MPYLILGLLIFLGAHSVRIVADGWRTRMRARWGETAWRLAFSLVSVAGFFLLVVGFGQTRQAPVQLWLPPMALRHLAALLTLGAFVLLAAAYVPGNQFKVRLNHPMVAAVKLWALAHLLANGNLGHVVLFGSFLLWAVADFVVSRRRDRAEGFTPVAVRKGATGITVALGVAAWVAFTLWLHGLLIGVRPFG